MKHFTIKEATYPVSVKQNDPGMMTLDDYLKFRNSGNKYHPSDAYDRASVASLNDYNQLLEPTVSRNAINLSLNSYGSGLVLSPARNSDIGDITYILRVDSRYQQDVSLSDIKGFIHEGTLFYNPSAVPPEVLPRFKNYYPNGSQKVKYPAKAYVSLVEQVVAEKNKEKYSSDAKILKQVKIKNKNFTFYHLTPTDWYGSVDVLSDGMIVARATNEWGTTLLQVANEYRGYGIGPILGELFIDLYQLPSGGYTPQGIANAKKMWAKRVSQYIESGWYSELIKQNKLSKGYVQTIISDYKELGFSPTSTIPSDETDIDTKEKPELLLYAEDGTFILYDKKLLLSDEPDESYIYGYAFFREFDNKFHLYRFDYDDSDPQYKILMGYSVLQYCRDNGEELYVGGLPSDYVDIEDLRYVEVDGDFMYLSKDVVELDNYIRHERQTRKYYDKYDEKYHYIHELADMKFGQ